MEKPTRYSGLCVVFEYKEEEFVGDNISRMTKEHVLLKDSSDLWSAMCQFLCKTVCV